MAALVFKIVGQVNTYRTLGKIVFSIAISNQNLYTSNLALISVKLRFPEMMFEDTLVALEIVWVRKRISNILKNALMPAM